jgi:hypothetical protein
MATDPEASPFGRVALAFIAAVALYLAAFFPAMSWEVRHPHPGHSGILSAWEPLPNFVIRPMFQVWVQIDPHGFASLPGQFQ